MIPTAPTIHLPDGWALNKSARGQKGAEEADHPFFVFLSQWRERQPATPMQHSTDISSNPVGKSQPREPKTSSGTAPNDAARVQKKATLELVQ